MGERPGPLVDQYGFILTSALQVSIWKSLFPYTDKATFKDVPLQNASLVSTQTMRMVRGFEAAIKPLSENVYDDNIQNGTAKKMQY